MNFRGEYVTFPIAKLDKGHGSILSQISIRRIIIGYTILIAKLDYRKTKRRVSNLATGITRNRTASSCLHHSSVPNLIHRDVTCSPPAKIHLSPRRDTFRQWRGYRACVTWHDAAPRFDGSLVTWSPDPAVGIMWRHDLPNSTRHKGIDRVFVQAKTQCVT